MGWRADRAYEEAQREDYCRWRASLTLWQRLAFDLHRARHVLLGAATGAAFILVLSLFV